jgi:hypothetical protein
LGITLTLRSWQQSTKATTPTLYSSYATHAHSRSEIVVLRHFNHPFSSSLAEIQRAIHSPSPAKTERISNWILPRLTFLGPKQKNRWLLVLEETLNQSKLKMPARMIIRPVPPRCRESGTDRPADNSQRQESIHTYDTSSQIPEMPPEVLGDEEDEQLVTYEKGLGPRLLQ